MSEVLRNRFAFCGKGSIVFLLQRGNSLSEVAYPIMKTEFIRQSYEEVNKELMSSLESGNLRIEIATGSAESFVSYIYLFSDRMWATLKSTALVACPVHVIILSVSTRVG